MSIGCSAIFVQMANNDEIKIIRPNPGGQTRFVRSNVDVCFFGGVLAGGKLLSVNELVLTPNGWVRNGDLKPGDVLCTPFGNPTKILAVFPHKDKAIYTLRTSDGRECMCGLEHLWEVRTRKQIYKYRKHFKNEDFSVLTTEEVIDGMEKGVTFFIPIPKAQEFGEKIYDIDPYILGKTIDIGGRIDDTYKFGSIGQRIRLLDGLAENKEVCERESTSGFIEYRVKDDGLTEDIIYILRSLGYAPTMPILKNGYNYFFIDKHSDHVLIESITYKCNEDALCILVEDKDHLYIAGDFVTTHNTFGAVLSTAESSQDSKFRGCFIRRTLGDLKVAGGVVEKFQEVYGEENVDVKKSESPLITFPSGATVECRQIQNEDIQKVSEQWKGSEYDLIAFEELTSFSWETFTYLMSRNRGKAKNTGHIIATTNPKKNHWVRKFIDAYVGYDGLIDPKMDGVVMYFYLNGEKVEDVVWGDTKKEVYDRCRESIDSKLKAFGGQATYENLIKSFTFILGKTSENVAMLENNKNYIGSIAATGAKRSQIFVEGNWDIDEDEDVENAAIKREDAKRCLDNTECTNGDLWITADLADVGKDNSVFLAWDGFHIFDIMIRQRCLPRDNAQWLQEFAIKHNIPDTHIIYDATRALYINDYIKDAVPYISSKLPRGILRRTARYLKDECYLRLASVIENGMLSISESVSSKKYVHQKNLGSGMTVGIEFLDECAVVVFEQLANGKKCLLGKKEMNKRLGHGRSMDVLDPIAMRMLPILEYPIGDELSVIDGRIYRSSNSSSTTGFDIYQESNWC